MTNRNVHSRSPATWIVLLTLVAFVAAFVLPPIPQSVVYHDFADHRHALGIANFLDVMSNAAFLVVGLLGLAMIARGRAFFEYSTERWPYVIFFIGVTLTAAGSAYYHLAPDNETLFWDRLPMTIAFMGLVCAQIVDRVSVRGGLRLLVPALIIGAASVIYWRWTERLGAGNVLPYGILQGYAVLVLLLLALFNPSRYTRGQDIFWVFGWYMLSKVLETFDHQLMWLDQGIVSGHTLKHLAAAAAGLVVCRMLTKRKLRPVSGGSSGQ
ncbi:MAG: hypothetical protein ACMV0J_01535 [Fluviibacter sp.]